MDAITKDENGKPVFQGQDEFVPSSIRKKDATQLVCRWCGKEVPYLVGEDTHDGGRMGCEQCWKPGKGVTHENERTEKTVFD